MAKHNFEYRKHPDYKKHVIKRVVVWCMAFVCTIAAVSMVNLNSTEFKASIIGSKSVPVFDGTVSPIQKTPNYVAFNSADYNLSYESIASSKIIDIPEYNPNTLKTSVSALTWGNPAHDLIRNAKITYSVPYMGNYKLDGYEYAGSHLAVDLKIPVGTPIYAIANGEVTKTSMQGGGFGNHLVIKHPNVPTYDNESIKETLYSSYSHMKSISVSEGKIVKKGDLIGYSGNSGLSTTPHLHFQIDRDSAPWHPYWPFTSKQASNAGLSFTEAVNQGLNQSDAIAKTVNPMLYVQKYKNGVVNQPAISAPVVSEPVITEPIVDDEIVKAAIEEVITEQIEEITPDLTTGEVNYELVTGSIFVARESMNIQLKALDKNGNLIKDFVPNGYLRIDTVRGSADIRPNSLTYRNFVDGIAEIKITPRTTNPLQLRVKSDNLIKSGNIMYEAGNNTLFADISDFHPNYEAIKFLKEEGVVQGYPDGSFQPLSSVSRVEIIKFILEGVDADIKTVKSLTFKDTNRNEWYADYLYTATNLEIVEGYPDGTFKPTLSVNRVEFLKMLIEAMNIDINPGDNLTPFSDVRRSQWYAPYVKFAHDKNLIDITGTKFEPNQAMQRDEVAEAIYRVKVLTETGSSKYTADLGNNFTNNAG